MNNRIELNWAKLALFSVIFFCICLMIFLIEKNYSKAIEEQLIECEFNNGDLSKNGVAHGSRCIIDGEKFEYVRTVNGWKLLKKNSDCDFIEEHLGSAEGYNYCIKKWSVDLCKKCYVNVEEEDN